MQLYLTLPKPGETIREGLIIQWLKKEGEFVNEKEPLVELETEKAVFTFESPFRGALKKILVSANENTPVGTKIALFEVNAEDGAKYEMLGVGIVRGEGREEGRGEREEGERKRPEESRAEKGEEVPLSLGRGQGEGGLHSELLSPYLRKLIQENHLSEEEVSKIPHSGFEGRLSKEDVLKYLSPKPPHSSLFTLHVLSPIRQRIAKHLTESIHEIPQAATSVEVDLTAIMEFRKLKSEEFKKNQGFSLSPFLFFAWAVKDLLQKLPRWNSHLIQENASLKIKQFHRINLSFAASTPQGLMTPVLQNAQNLSFLQLAQGIKALEEKARLGQLSVDELSGGTFLMNNPGALGGNRSHQLLPKPLVGIVALNKIQKRPWVLDEGIHIREISTLDLSFDHRVFDGAEAIQLIEALKGYLENFPFDLVESY
ncbi:MAG: 2-oxo acid dehydrogenase subunit E2 [Deltaproteobacteria bacterium]|nr:2-oxo acid dehydrogenase subunit E2 [Deltaproteobacteria bacterium]